MRSYFIFLYLFLFSISLVSQNRSFAIINSGEKIITSDEDLNHTPEFDTIVKIYNDLVNARGDFRYLVPPLYLREEEGYVASIDYDKSEIILEKKAYDVCKKYGTRAFAFLLGHELTHFYEKHAWREKYASEIADLELGKTLLKSMDQVANETEADYLGGFLAYTAGYGMFDKGGDIINDLYAAYHLGENLTNYPSKSDRITLAQRSADKLKELVQVFEMANMLAAVGRHVEAYDYYKYILQYFPSREIYNNLGTVAVLSSMPLFNKDSLKFKYISELDINFKGSKGIGSKRDSILMEAIYQFNAALSLDPSYAPAYLNKANAYALLGDSIRARFYLEQEAIPAAEKDTIRFAKTLIDCEILQGILDAKSGKTRLADLHFSNAAGKGSKVAEFNLNALRNVPQPLNTANASYDFTKDTVDGNVFFKFVKSPSFDEKKQFGMDHNNVFFQSPEDDKKCKVLFNRNGDSKVYLFFMVAAEDYLMPNSIGVGNGSTEKDVRKLNGEPMQTIETVTGSMLVYDSILYYIENGKVVKWAIYESKKKSF